MLRARALPRAFGNGTSTDAWKMSRHYSLTEERGGRQLGLPGGGTVHAETRGPRKCGRLSCARERLPQKEPTRSSAKWRGPVGAPKGPASAPGSGAHPEGLCVGGEAAARSSSAPHYFQDMAPASCLPGASVSSSVKWRQRNPADGLVVKTRRAELCALGHDLPSLVLPSLREDMRRESRPAGHVPHGRSLGGGAHRFTPLVPRVQGVGAPRVTDIKTGVSPLMAAENGNVF